MSCYIVGNLKVNMWRDECNFARNVLETIRDNSPTGHYNPSHIKHPDESSGNVDH